MRRLIVSIITAITLMGFMPAYADGPKRHFPNHGLRHGGHHHHHHGHWRRHHNHWQWVVPAIIGGIIVYEVTKPPQTVVIQNEITKNCSPWTEVQNPDGTITRTRTCDK